MSESITAAQPPTMEDMCREIVAEMERHGGWIRNTVTGRTIPNAAGVYDWQDVWHWSSHGELMHIFEWYLALGCTGVENYIGRRRDDAPRPDATP